MIVIVLAPLSLKLKVMRRGGFRGPGIPGRPSHCQENGAGFTNRSSLERIDVIGCRDGNYEEVGK
jgi:hypothetical protein